MYRSSILSSRFWGEALRDDTKNDCVKDKPTTNSFLISVFMILKKKRQINYLKVRAQNAAVSAFNEPMTSKVQPSYRLMQR